MTKDESIRLYSEAIGWLFNEEYKLTNDRKGNVILTSNSVKVEFRVTKRWYLTSEILEFRVSDRRAGKTYEWYSQFPSWWLGLDIVRRNKFCQRIRDIQVSWM